MTDCWLDVPERRPTFTDLVNRLEVLLNPPKRHQAGTEVVDDEPTYMNTSDPKSKDYLQPVGSDPDSKDYLQPITETSTV